MTNTATSVLWNLQWDFLSLDFKIFHYLVRFPTPFTFSLTSPSIFMLQPQKNSPYSLKTECFLMPYASTPEETLTVTNHSEVETIIMSFLHQSQSLAQPLMLDYYNQ